MTLDRIILGAVRCVRCGAGHGKCSCWVTCACGWAYGRGEQCQNPKCGGTGNLQVIAATKTKRKR